MRRQFSRETAHVTSTITVPPPAQGLLTATKETRTVGHGRKCFASLRTTGARSGRQQHAQDDGCRTWPALRTRAANAGDGYVNA
jgi:hypothetical protein